MKRYPCYTHFWLFFLLTNPGLHGIGYVSNKNCGYCCKEFTETTTTYGCSHQEHPLCVYEVLEIENEVEGFIDLIACSPSTSFSYHCPTCEKICSLGFYARHRLYADCTKMLAVCPTAMQRAYITALPSYLVKKLVAAMDMNEQMLYFAPLPPQKFWNIVKQLPLENWENYKKMSNEENRKKIEEATPPDVAFMQQKRKERIIGFKALPLKTQQETIVTFWPELSIEEITTYLQIIFKQLDEIEGKSIAQRVGLFAALIANHDLPSKERSRSFSELIKGVTKPYRFANKIAGIAQNAEEGAAFLDEIWDKINSSQRNKLALLMLSLPVTSPFKQYHIPSVLGGLSPSIAYSCIKMLFNQPLSTDQAHALIKATMGKFNEQRRYKIYKTILKNNSINPSPKALAQLISSFPYDLAYGCVQKGLKKLSNNAQALSFIQKVRYSLTPQQRILLLKEFMQAGEFSPLEIQSTISLYGHEHQMTYGDQTSLFYDFFNSLVPCFDEIFTAWARGKKLTEIYATKLAIELWPLIPEKGQQRYFNLLQPEKRSLLLRTFSWNEKQHKRLQKFSADLNIDMPLGNEMKRKSNNLI